MAEIRLWNTKTKRKDPLDPTVVPGKVSMYVCGPTVYDRAHMGNARPAIVFDVLFRLLRHQYGAENVRYVRNLTDVDDKIIRRAEESGRPIDEITEETIRWYHDDMAALGVLPPDVEPRATEYVGQMIAMIEGLIASGHAYAAEGHVLFAVESYADYGRLSGRSVEDMIAGARVEVAPYKRNPMDFVLWKPSDDDVPGWESPWGRGRPGWHIECSAMSHALLGPSFDIHGGGNDLMFPHHENEIAQSRCAHPEGDFARIWMHNEMLQVEGKKMSKSLGNFFTVHDVLEQGIPGEVIRFVYLKTHYRKPMNWTEKERLDAEKRLDALLPALRIANDLGVPPSQSFADLPLGMQLSLADDLNTSGAITALEDSAKRLRDVEAGAVVPIEQTKEAGLRKAAEEFASGLEILGLHDLLLRRSSKQLENRGLLDDLHRDFVTCYELAKQTKDFGLVDERKRALADAGVDVRISRDGIELVPGPEFSEGKLEGLK